MNISQLLKYLTFSLIILQFCCNKENSSEPETQPIPDPIKLYLRDNKQLSFDPYPSSPGYSHVIESYLYVYNSSPLEWSTTLNGDLVGSHCAIGIYAYGVPNRSKVFIEFLIKKLDGTEISLCSFIISPIRTSDLFEESEGITDPETVKGDIFIVRFVNIGDYVSIICYDGTPHGNGDSYIEIPGGGL